MDFQVRISEEALADLEEIVEYSWANFPQEIAARFAQGLLNHVEMLGRYPYLGMPVAKRENVRQLVHMPIPIHYRVDEKRRNIEVLHFRHGRREGINT